ncbi:MAG: AMP-binding protein [Caldisphaera sp.]|nr:AMP-binding protein [Caldisphaera sp.]
MVEIFDIRKFGNNIEEIRKNFKWPDDFNLPNVVDQWEGLAIIEDNKNLSYQYLREKSNGVAKFLSDIGIKKGDIVGGLMRQSADLLISILGSYKKGSIFMSMSILLGTESIKNRIEKTKAKVIFTESSQIKKIKESNTKALIVSDGEGDYSFNDIPKINDIKYEIKKSDPAHLLFTSGSTGEPKGALLPYTWILGILPSFQVSLDLPPKNNDIFMTPIEYAWIGGLGNMALPSLYLGIPLVIYKREGKFDPYDLLQKYEDYKITGTVLVPTALRMIKKIGNDIQKYDLRLRAILTGSDIVTKDLYDYFEGKLGIDLNNTYGQTETGLVTCESSLIMKKKSNTVGIPCPGHKIVIVNEKMEFLKNDETGEIALLLPDPGAMISYFDNQGSSLAKIPNNIILTGDLGYLDNEGYLVFIGRKDDVIKTSSYRINPVEIESVLNEHESVKQSAVIGIEDEMKGMKIVAFIVLKEGFEGNDKLKENIKNFIKEKLATYAYPNIIYFVDTLPTTTTGKIRRKELKNFINKIS